MNEEEEEIKKRMKRFIAADNAMRRDQSGFLGSFIKFCLVIGIVGGTIYGIYYWHPWKEISEFTEGPNIGNCKYGYQTTRATELFGLRFGESHSIICTKDFVVE